MRCTPFTVTVALCGLWAASAQAQEIEPLPRQRLGGTPYDTEQSLHPYVLFDKAADDPSTVPAALVTSAPEYDPVHGVIYWFGFGQWHQTVVECVVALTSDPAHDEIAYIVLNNASQQSTATTLLTNNGADMSKVVFIQQPGNSIWMRDYGPHFVWQDDTLNIVDSHYYPTRPLDNFSPTLLADPVNWDVESSHMGVYFSGGNFMPGPNRSAFMSSLVTLDNTTGAGFDVPLLEELYNKYQGIDTMHILPQLPFSVDGTGHIDMWMYLVDEDTCIISEFKPGSNATAISVTNNAVPYMEGLGFEVFRTPAWNVGSTHYTYANAYRVNNRIFVPFYGDGNAAYTDEDADAVAAWTAAAGAGVEIVPIDCYSIIPASGAIHCIIKQVPRYTSTTPAACIQYPAGGELIAGGETITIEWEATDTYNADLDSVDLLYTLDGGSSWVPIASGIADTGEYDWSVPMAHSSQARVKVVASATDSDTAEAESASNFEISPVVRTTYDFSTGAGVNKFGYGFQKGTWNGGIAGNRTPVASALVAGEYTAMSTSNATGGDGDSNRYISTAPGNGQESTHYYEFTLAEDPADIDEIKVYWEGYADQCTQAELYVWDYTNSEWGDGSGLLGQNRFMANTASNRDDLIVGRLTSNFSDFVNGSGQMTFLVYGERSKDETFTDYMSVQVTIKSTSTGVSYCTAGTSANGCQATLSSVGTASASASSGFSLDAATVEGAKDGLYFFGTNGRQANTWGSGTSFQCVVPPVNRAGLLTGNGTAGLCDGSFSQDLNALWCPTCPKPQKNPGAGTVVQAQLWYRDPQNTSNQTTSLSDAVEFLVAP